MIAVGFGVAPACARCATLDAAGLREGSRGGVGGRRERLRGALVMAEVTLSVVLLVSAGLLIRALWHVQAGGSRLPDGRRPDAPHERSRCRGTRRR